MTFVDNKYLKLLSVDHKIRTVFAGISAGSAVPEAEGSFQ
jgi:hypothetical protein